jgi:hypothetical protein
MSAKISQGDRRLTTRAGQPYYNPDDWPHTIHVETEDGQETMCSDFPDTNIGGWAYDTQPTTYDVFCWQNGTIENLGDMFLKTTKDCYLDENDIKEGNTTDIDFTKLVPCCGPLRPYEVYSTKLDYLLPIYGYYQNCWLDTTLNSPTVEIDWYSVHTYCWVNGTAVGSSKYGRNSQFWVLEKLTLHVVDGMKMPRESMERSVIFHMIPLT